MNAAGVANRAAQLPSDLIAAGFEPEFVAVKNGAALGDSHYDTLLMDAFVLEAGLTAEDRGFAAVCIDTVSDSGLYALRSRLSIPVLGPGQCAFHMAAMVAKRFTVLTMWDEWFPLYQKTLTEYGLWAQVASLRSIKTRPDVEDLLVGKEEVIFKKLEAEAIQAIDNDGAGAIVLGSTTMHQSHKYLASCLPVPVINPGAVCYKFAELFVDLGLTHSRVAFPAPECVQDTSIQEFLQPAG